MWPRSYLGKGSRGCRVERISKRIACDAIESRKDVIISIAEDILHHPETGFTEHRTARLVADWFSQLGVPYTEGVGLTGVKARLDGGAGAGPQCPS